MYYTQKDILDSLDNYNQGPGYFFIDLEPPYTYTAGSGLTLYADEYRWAVVFELSGFGTASYGVEMNLTYFGNCLINFNKNEKAHSIETNWTSTWIIEYDELKRIEFDSGLVAKDKQEIRVRDQFLPIEHDVEMYDAKDMDIRSWNNPDNLINLKSLARYLQEEYPSVFRATDSELRAHIPVDLPFIMHINEWYHERFYEGAGSKPSSYETYQMIADVLVTRDPSKWQPTLAPNTNWRNWLEAGYM